MEARKEKVVAVSVVGVGLVLMSLFFIGASCKTNQETDAATPIASTAPEPTASPVYPNKPKTKVEGSVCSSSSDCAGSLICRHSVCSSPTCSDYAAAAEVSTTGRIMYAEYKSNQIAADNKYKDKIVLIKGQVNEVRKDLFGKPYIELAGDGYGFFGPQAYINSREMGNASLISKGDVIELVCVGAGYRVITPALGDCCINKFNAE